MCFINPISFLTRLFYWSMRGKTMNIDMNIDEETAVFFDLETTGLDTTVCHIVQLSAISRDKTFNAYIVPRRSMTEGASKVTGLTVEGGALLLYRRRVRTVPLRQALADFIAFLKTFNRPILVGHNSKRFDWPILSRTLRQLNLLEEFQSVVSSCVDTLSLSREMFQLERYSQPFLVQHFLRQSYAAHDATEDVRTLQDLYGVWKPGKDLVNKHKIIL